MDSVLWRVEALLQQHIDLAQTALLVACSGGPDSVALLHMLHKKREEYSALQVYAAHLHHGIRGKQADADAAFVEDLCAQWSIPCMVERADVPVFSKETGKSLEEAARMLRYAFLRRMKEQVGAAYIVTAHHMQDQAETILLHMLRGCGLGGLCGMRAQSGDVLRPLLSTPKEEIEGYIADWSLPTCTDETNADTTYLRNRVRHELLPLLSQRFNPSIVEGLNHMASLLEQDEQYLSGRAEAALNDSAINGEVGVYDRGKLAGLPMSIKSRAIRIALSRASALNDMQQGGILRVCDLLQARTGAFVELPNGLRAWANYGNLHIGRMQGDEGAAFSIPYRQGEVVVPGGRIRSVLADKLHKDEGPLVAYMDEDKLPDGLVIRRRQPGDRFFPLGAQGTRKLKQYLIDKKIPRECREIPMLAKEQNVIFFPGGTIAEQVKVTEDTTRIIRVEFLPDKMKK